MAETRLGCVIGYFAIKHTSEIGVVAIVNCNILNFGFLDRLLFL